MTKILYDYHLDSTTWVYLASLLVITVFFRFSPLLRLRNLDILGLVALAPGLVMLEASASGIPHARQAEYAGSLWMFAVGLFFLSRMLVDSFLVRRPLLEPNLNTGGITFLGVALLLFLSMRIATEDFPPTANAGFNSMFAGLPGQIFDLQPNTAQASAQTWHSAARTTAIVSQLLLVVGLVVVGQRHFRNLNAGLAVATLYLLLPGTALQAARPELTCAGALLVWMTVFYRMPLVSGVLLGVTTGAVYYPLFLLPLWCGFYWTRGIVRFLGGVAVSLLVLVALLALTPQGVGPFWHHIQAMFGWSAAELSAAHGLWGIVFQPAYRIPAQITFFALCMGLALWPVHKNLGTLLSGSTAVMLGTQFWQLQGGGASLGWYLPLLLLTVFRPNLEDRVALSTLGQGWLRPRIGLWPGQKAA